MGAATAAGAGRARSFVCAGCGLLVALLCLRECFGGISIGGALMSGAEDFL